MTQKEIERKLSAAGWKLIAGAKHNMAIHPDKPGQKIPIPRHRGDIPIGTANSILKAAGLK